MLYATLRVWRIGVRSSRLLSVPLFADALRKNADGIAALDGMSIDDPFLHTASVVDQIARLITSLGVVENQAKLVSGTKTLHHLLPDLVPPMDRAWTGRFLGMHQAEWQSPANQSRILTTAFSGMARVAREVSPQQFVGSGWRSSKTKILDNAIIGFCAIELPSLRADRQPSGRSSDAASGPGADNQRARGSYSPLTAWLAQQTEATVTIRFADLEAILGRQLPRSARRDKPWWANASTHSQARAWLSAGWRVDGVDMRGETVRFSRRS